MKGKEDGRGRQSRKNITRQETKYGERKKLKDTEYRKTEKKSTIMQKNGTWRS